jgi:hypothetical protein
LASGSATAGGAGTFAAIVQTKNNYFWLLALGGCSDYELRLTRAQSKKEWKKRFASRERIYKLKNRDLKSMKSRVLRNPLRDSSLTKSTANGVGTGT